MANIKIDIASEFTGRKAFQEASKATSGLESAVDKLGKKMLAAFSVAKIAQFSKESIKAYMADQQAAAALANQLKNLGLAYSTPDIEKFIAKMQSQTGILDDELRPAFASLIRVMGSIPETQKAMASAFDIAKGSGKSFQEVVNALSQAYVGNTKGLKNLGIGLTNAELKTKTYAQLLEILNAKFKGAGAAALDTYAGKLDLLNVSIANAKETIGQGFLDAFTLIANDGDFKTVTDSISSMAENVANTLVGVGAILDTVRSKFDSMPDWVKNVFRSKQFQSIVSPATPILGALSKLGAKTKISQAMPYGITNFLDEQKQKSKKAAEDKAARNAATRAKQLADLIKKQAAAQADLLKKKQDAAKLDALSLQYKKAEAIFDLDKIEIQAALMNKQTNEDYARLQLKRDLILLQEAINNKDVVAATALAKIVEDDYKRVQAYQAINLAIGVQIGLISNLKAAADLIPTNLNIINTDNLKSALDYIKKLIDQLSKLPTGGGQTTTEGKQTTKKPILPELFGTSGEFTTRALKNIPSVTETPMEQLLRNFEEAYPILQKNNEALKPIADSGFFDLYYNAKESMGTPINPYQLSDAQGQAYSRGQLLVTVNNNTNGLAEIIMSTTQDQSANGINTRLERNTSGLAW